MPYTLGVVLNEGKTKRILKIIDDEKNVVLESKDDLTAGDGAKHEVILGKGELATRTTCAVFQLIKDSGLPVAYK